VHGGGQSERWQTPSERLVQFARPGSPCMSWIRRRAALAVQFAARSLRRSGEFGRASRSGGDRTLHALAAARFHTQWSACSRRRSDLRAVPLLAAQAMTNAALQEELTAEGLSRSWTRSARRSCPHSQPGSAAWLVADRRPNCSRPSSPSNQRTAGFRDEPHLGSRLSDVLLGLTATRSPTTAVASASQLSFVALPKDPDVSTAM